MIQIEMQPPHHSAARRFSHGAARRHESPGCPHKDDIRCPICRGLDGRCHAPEIGSEPPAVRDGILPCLNVSARGEVTAGFRALSISLA